MQKTLGILKFVLQYFFILFISLYIFWANPRSHRQFLHPLLKVGSSNIFKTLINKYIKPRNKQHVIVFTRNCLQ